MSPQGTRHRHPLSVGDIAVHRGVLRSVGLDGCTVTRFHHHGTVQSPLCATRPSLPRTPTPGRADLCTVSAALPFPACHVVGITRVQPFPAGVVTRSRALRVLRVYPQRGLCADPQPAVRGRSSSVPRGRTPGLLPSCGVRSVASQTSLAHVLCAA